MWVTSLGLAGEAGIFASRPFYRMFSGVPNGPLRLSPPQVHAAVHNSGVQQAQSRGPPQERAKSRARLLLLCFPKDNQNMD